MSSSNQIPGSDLILVEEWKDIPEYVGLYQVSSQGTVKRLEGSVKRLHLGKVLEQPIRERVLKTSPSTSKEYPAVNLCKEGICKPKYVHVLVAQAFLGERPAGMQVCHNEKGVSNPSSTNLRYDTPVGNAADRHLHGTDAKGENNPSSKYTEEQIANVKYDLISTPQHLVAKDWGIPKSTIRSIKQGKRWNHVEPQKEKPLFVTEM